MDIVYLRDLRIDTVIGIYDWERRTRQTIIFDLEMSADIARAAASDDIADTLIRAGKSLRTYKRANIYHKTCLLHYDDWKIRFDRWLRIHSRLYLSYLRATGWRASLGRVLDHVRFLHNPNLPVIPKNEPRPWTLDPSLREWYPEMQEGWDMLCEDILAIREDCAQRGAGQGLDCGETAEEPLVFFNDPRNLGLLQHQLRQEDVVRIAGLSPGESPLVEPIVVVDCLLKPAYLLGA